MGKIKVTGILDYVMGNLRHGHMELIIEGDEWEALNKDEQIERLKYDSKFVLDDYNLEDRGNITDIIIEEI